MDRLQQRVTIPLQYVTVPPEELRLLAASSGHEVWERIRGGDAYFCRDLPGVVLSRDAVRARPRTLLMDAAVAPVRGTSRRG